MSESPRGAAYSGLFCGSQFNDILQLFLNAQPLLMTAPLAFPCDRRDWQDTVCRISLALDNIVHGVVDGRSRLALTKPRLCLSPQAGPPPTCLHRTYGFRAESLPFSEIHLHPWVEFDAGLDLHQSCQESS
ncbi:hypothetical protein GWK47_000803 [Chionoecetes opilio]|uniref:Uncharacterized protein n=1 Tax=Chionoecetes opilio TaxID=41210 RepID=A0A8J4Y8R2_CHIOP|nr:hypothetical protein GWK47_000803 [Chionoecetes opilio]